MTAPSQQSCTDYCSFTFLAERGQALQKCICGYIARDLRKGCCDVAVFARKKTAGCFPVAHRKYHAFFRNVHAIFNRGGSTKNKHTHTHVFDSKGSQRELRTLIHAYLWWICFPRTKHKPNASTAVGTSKSYPLVSAGAGDKIKSLHARNCGGTCAGHTPEPRPIPWGKTRRSWPPCGCCLVRPPPWAHPSP